MLIQISANRASDDELVNAGMRPQLAEFAARGTAEQTLSRIESINEVRRRIVGSNVAPLLAIEAMTVSLL